MQFAVDCWIVYSNPIYISYVLQYTLKLAPPENPPCIMMMQLIHQIIAINMQYMHLQATVCA